MGKGCSFDKFEKSVSGGGAAPEEKESRPLLKEPFRELEMDEVPEEDAPSTGDGFVVGFIV